MTLPGDPGLSQRLRAQVFVRQGEQRVARAWFRSLTRWLDRVRPGVTSGGRIDPGRVSDQSTFWTNEINVSVIPTIRSVLGDAWARIRSQPPAQDPWVSDYLNDAGNRLVRLPDEVYSRVVADVERGVREGRPLPDVAADIDRLLTATGSERWPNRAIAVARTETIGAVNAGVFRSAVLDAADRGDPEPMKVWISTEDSRTRPTHVAADKQRTSILSPFRVGGSQLMFPGDPRGPAHEVINCRCSMAPVFLGEELDWTDRQNARG